MSQNNIINTCVRCIKSFDNAMELWVHYIGPWCGDWPDYIKMDTSDNETMAGIKIIDPDQAEKEESESFVACKSCDKSFDSDMEFITNEIEKHSISSWSEEVDTEEKMEDIDSDASKKRKSSDDKS